MASDELEAFVDEGIQAGAVRRNLVLRGGLENLDSRLSGVSA